MYKSLKKINNITGVKCINNSCFYNDGTSLICNDKEIIKGVEGSSFWAFSDNYIYYYNEDGERFCKYNSKEYKVEFPFFVNTFQDSKIFCKTNFRRESRKWIWELGVFDLDKVSLLKSYQISNFTIEIVTSSKCVGYYHRDKIIALNINNLNEDRWMLDIEGAEFEKVIGIWQNQLIIACTDNLLLSINVNTGKIHHKWKELKDFEAGQFYKDVLPEPADFVLDKSEGKLIGTFDVYYFEIDLSSGKVSYENIRDELASFNINSFRRMGNNPFTSKHLFVTADAESDDRPNVDLDCVLALNRNTKKIDWMHIFKDTGLGTNVPGITSTHLYQLDTEKILHIFKKV